MHQNVVSYPILLDLSIILFAATFPEHQQLLPTLIYFLDQKVIGRVGDGKSNIDDLVIVVFWWQYLARGFLQMISYDLLHAGPNIRFQEQLTDLWQIVESDTKVVHLYGVILEVFVILHLPMIQKVNHENKDNDDR